MHCDLAVVVCDVLASEIRVTCSYLRGRIKIIKCETKMVFAASVLFYYFLSFQLCNCRISEIE